MTTLDSGAFPLSFEYRPAQTDGPAPAILLLHGRETNEHDLLPLGAELPDELHVVSLRAPFPGQHGNVWYELDLSAGDLHSSQPVLDELEQSMALVAEFRDQLVEALDVTAVGLLGFSQGGITSLSLLLNDPERFAWAVALHSYLPAEYDPASMSDVAGIPVFLGAGQADQIIPPFRVADAAERLRAGGLAVSAETYPVGHGIHPQELADASAWISERLSPSAPQ